MKLLHQLGLPSFRHSGYVTNLSDTSTCPFKLVTRILVASILRLIKLNAPHACSTRALALLPSRRWQRLNVESNQLHQLPLWLGSCGKLEQLILSYNPLTTIPVSRRSWPALADLVCCDCEFGLVGLLHLWRNLEAPQDMMTIAMPLYKQVCQ